MYELEELLDLLSVEKLERVCTSTVYNLIGYIENCGELNNDVFIEFLKNNFEKIGG